MPTLLLSTLLATVYCHKNTLSMLIQKNYDLFMKVIFQVSVHWSAGMQKL